MRGPLPFSKNNIVFSIYTRMEIARMKSIMLELALRWIFSRGQLFKAELALILG